MLPNTGSFTYKNFITLGVSKGVKVRCLSMPKHSFLREIFCPDVVTGLKLSLKGFSAQSLTAGAGTVTADNDGGAPPTAAGSATIGADPSR